jgi:hypothetical protein
VFTDQFQGTPDGLDGNFKPSVEFFGGASPEVMERPSQCHELGSPRTWRLLSEKLLKIVGSFLCGCVERALLLPVPVKWTT